MEYIHLDQSRPLDLILLGRIAIDFNPAWNDQVKEDFKPLRKVHNFEMYVGGSPANVALGTRKHGMKVGFIGMVSDDQFGDFVTEYFADHGIDTSRIVRAKHGEKLGLTFTEMCSCSGWIQVLQNDNMRNYSIMMSQIKNSPSTWKKTKSITLRWSKIWLKAILR